MAGVLVRDNWVCLFVGKYVFYSISIPSFSHLPHSCLRPFYLLILPSPEDGNLRDEEERRITLIISTLFLIAAIQYIYITYLGYNALPFIARSEILLAPLLPIFGGYVSLSLPLLPLPLPLPLFDFD